MLGRAKQLTPSLSAPNWNDPAELALWHLSLVLREIGESAPSGSDKREPSYQVPAEHATTGGSLTRLVQTQRNKENSQRGGQ